MQSLINNEIQMSMDSLLKVTRMPEEKLDNHCDEALDVYPSRTEDGNWWCGNGGSPDPDPASPVLERRSPTVGFVFHVTVASSNGLVILYSLSALSDSKYHKLDAMYTELFSNPKLVSTSSNEIKTYLVLYIRNISGLVVPNAVVGSEESTYASSVAYFV